MKENICFIYDYRSRFIEIDINCLNDSYCIEEYDMSKNSISNGLLKLFKSKVLIFWFINYKTLAPLLLGKLFGKRILVISGGYDISDIKGYGMFQTYIGEICQTIQFKLTDTIMVNSISSYRELSMRIPTITNKLFWTYHALDWCPVKQKSDNREIDFITIGTLKSVNLKRKGLGRFIELAKEYPEKKFVLIGPVIDEGLSRNVPENLNITGFIDESKKLDLLWRSTYYFQYSQHEGFGVSVLEAQLCGCYILYNPVYALPEVVKYGKAILGNDLQLPDRKNNLDEKEILNILQEFSYEKRVLALKSMLTVILN